MRRSEQREHIFKLLFMTQFNSENEMSDQVSMYFDTLGELEEKDQEAIVDFQQEIDDKYLAFSTEEERIEYLIKENYYEDFLEKYKMDDIVRLTEKAFSLNFKFQSFMAISKFYKDYALKSNDKQKRGITLGE